MGRLRSFLGRIRRRWFWARLRARNEGRPASAVFADYWGRNHWRNPETRSGDGSTLAYTEPLRRELPALLARIDARSMLDLPCGDFNWMRHVALPPGFEYTGADIVPKMIDGLQARHGGPGRRFVCIDALTEPVPDADLWMCRDLIFHLPNADIVRVLERFARSRVGHLLITSHAATQGVNTDTFMGGFQLVNLQQPPFALPEPRARLTDHVSGYPERYLLLYRREDVVQWLEQRRVPTADAGVSPR